MVTAEELRFYSTQSAITDPGRFASLFDQAPDDLGEMARWVRNVHFHEAYAEQAGLDLPDDAASDPAVRFLEPSLARIMARDDRPLDVARSKQHCFIGTCRDYAVMLCSLIRHQGRPARVRCGFAFYYEPGANFGADHWVTEIWDGGEGRWRLADAEVDPELAQHQAITIDPFDLPRDRFLVAGTAWALCRNGKADPETYGVMGQEIRGQWFMAANVVRDLAALNKREVTVFDYWGMTTEICNTGNLTGEQGPLVDVLAALGADGSFDFDDLRRAYDQEPGVRVSDPVTGWPKGVGTAFTLGLA